MKRRERKKIHPAYFRVRGMQILNGMSDVEMAAMLGCSTRTYRDKVSGWSDFRTLEVEKLTSYFNISKDYLFFTGNVSRSEQSETA